MLGRTAGAVLIGAEARLVDVEVHLGGGLPAIAAVGLPNSSVREGIDRIRAALSHSGFSSLNKRLGWMSWLCWYLLLAYSVTSPQI